MCERPIIIIPEKKPIVCPDVEMFAVARDGDRITIFKMSEIGTEVDGENTCLSGEVFCIEEHQCYKRGLADLFVELVGDE